MNGVVWVLMIPAIAAPLLALLPAHGKGHLRPGAIRFPVWTDATFPCCRIAYLDGTTLRVVNGDGPCNKERLATRVKAHEDGAWVRDAALAYSEKERQRELQQVA